MAMPAPARPALRYHGGKWTLAPWIVSHLPPHTCYVEPFGGAASVLLRKEPSPIEIYNDLDGRVVNFFRVLRDHTDDLVRAIELTPYSREELRLSGEPSEDEIESARRFFVRSWQGFGSPTRSHKIGWAYQRDYGGRVKTRIPQWNGTDHLYAVAARFKTVYIEQDPALEVIKRFDGVETLFYCDPPYLRSLRNPGHRDYQNELTDADHTELAEALHSVKGMVVVSGYISPLYQELFAGWKCLTKKTQDMDSSPRIDGMYMNAAACERPRQLHLELMEESEGWEE